jgi:hypothetical protein
MIKKVSAALFLVLGLGVQMAFAAPVNIVTNGDFESGGPMSVPGWTMAPDPDSVVFAGGQSVGTDFSGSPNAHSGKVFNDAAYNTVGYISQNLMTTIGAVYKLEFDLQRFGNPTNPVDNFAQVSFGGVVLFQQTNVDADWMHFVFDNLIATSALTSLQFGNRNYWDYNQLDNVSVVDTAVVAPPPDPGRIPEPASAALVLAGLGLLGRTRRRQA